MRTLHLLVSLLILHNTFAQTSTTIDSRKHGKMEFRELDYGLADAIEGTQNKLESSPTGKHGWLKDFVILKVTDSIEVVDNARFGVVYIVKTKKDVDINVEIEWIYPEEISSESGKKFKSVRYITKRPTNTPSASSYNLNNPYEMVKGNWVLNIYVEKTKVYTKTFILY